MNTDMQHMAASWCDCCGLAVNLTQVQVCPACQYPVDPAKERAFLETSLCDLRRVVSHGGASITVADLIRRYEQRLFALTNPQTLAASVPKPAQEQVATLSSSAARAVPDQPAGALPVAASSPARVPSQVAGEQAGPVQPATSMRGFSLSSDAIVNILATLGSFLILAGALGFALTTADLRVSCGGIFLLQVVFGVAGQFAQRRFPQLRAVAKLYTLISALLVPLVGFSAYRLVTNDLVAFSPPLLLTLAACYAATVYGLLAVTQRFVPFAYLGVIALLTADLALAQALHLAYWWWPCSAMLLALASLGAVSRPSGSNRFFAEERAILRTPLVMLMYTVVAAVVLLALFLFGDSFLMPLPEKHLAIFFISCLVLVWCVLFIWRTGRRELLPVLAYLFLATLLLLGYVLNMDRAGYILLLAVVALGYHGLARVANGGYAARSLPALALDQLAMALSFLVLLLAASALPFQIFTRALHGPSAWESFLLPGSLGTFSFAPEAGLPFELLALGLSFLTTFDTSRVRAGQASTPARTAWHWLLLLSGLLLASIYGLLVLLWNVEPLWAFLALSLALLACAVLTRRIVGAAWANPLDVLALGEILFTLCLGLGQTPEVGSALLCGLAAVLYLVLLYQRRPWPSLLCTCLLLLALPFLLVHPLPVLGISLLLPLVCAGIQRAWFSGKAAVAHRSVFVWALLGPALVYGLAIANSALAGGQSVLTNELHLHLSGAYDIAATGLAWYIAALVARQKLWLAPATLFWVLALILPANSFWALCVLAVALAILAAAAERRVSLIWALPFYLTALCSSGMVVYTGLLSPHFTALSWVLLGFALLACVLGLVNNRLAALWLTPVYATLALLVAGVFLGDLYRPPLVTIAGAVLGVVISRFPALLRLAQRSQHALRCALPWYATALSAAVLTGISGSLGNINRPFYGAVPDVLLLDALIALVVLRLERRPRWCWLVAGFASWGVLLMQQLTPLFLLGTGAGLLLASQLSGRLFAETPERKQSWQRLSWSWPWYAAFLVALLVFDSGSVVANPATTDQFMQVSLAFTGLAVLAMVIERAPEVLFIPVVQATWTLHLLLLGAPAALLTLAYTLLCILIFATQFLWRLRTAAAAWLPETTLHNVLSLGGLCLVLLNALSQGALSPESGWLAQAGVLALVTLSLLIFLYGLTHAPASTREPAQIGDEQKRAHRSARARSVRHWCSYSSGLLLALAACWELLAFRQTRIDVLTLVPASYLIIVAPFLLRDQALPARQIVGQAVSLAGSALLLLPALWLSFNGGALLPTLVLLAESLVLLALGLIIRLRIFILSSAALVVVGTLRMLFLSVPQSVPLLLMLFGSLLVLLATGLILARHRLQEAWRQWG